jgi:serine protease
MPIRKSARLGLAAMAAALLVPVTALAQDTPGEEAWRSENLPVKPTNGDELPASVTDVESAIRERVGDPAAYDVPGTVIIDAKDDLEPSAIAALAARFGLTFTPTDLEPQTRIQLAEVPATEMASWVERLSRDPDVQRAEPLALVHALYDVDDPLLAEQWHMDRVGAPRAWDFATGRGVTVAVVDTGIACEDYGPFMKGTDLQQTTCVGGWSFVSNSEHANDDQGHGSHVAGTIAQSTNNGVGAAGLAFHARLMPVKVLNENGWGTTADVADGIRWAAENGAQVINLSLGGPRNSTILQDAVDFALSQGVVVVAAAGNSGGRVGYPGASEGVIGVSATGPDDKIAKFSSRGEGVDIAAPGVNVVQQTVCKRGRDKCEIYPGYSGTSMASPHVAGAAAMLVGLGVTDPKAVEEALRASARKVDESEGAEKLYGAGVLDVAAATQRVTLVHGVFRFLAVLAFGMLVWASSKKLAARKAGGSATSPWRMSFLVPALAAGPGLLFFAPWVLPRVHLPVDLLARPLPELDYYIGASLHQWLPLASALLPFALTTLFYGIRSLRPLVAGLSVGTAAYLASVAALGEMSGPLGKTALLAWCAVNAVLCLWIARTNLTDVESKTA